MFYFPSRPNWVRTLQLALLGRATVWLVCFTHRSLDFSRAYPLHPTSRCRVPMAWYISKLQVFCHRVFLLRHFLRDNCAEHKHFQDFFHLVIVSLCLLFYMYIFFFWCNLPIHARQGSWLRLFAEPVVSPHSNILVRHQKHAVKAKGAELQQRVRSRIWPDEIIVI